LNTTHVPTDDIAIITINGPEIERHQCRGYRDAIDIVAEDALARAGADML
jgi:hypothetical protein